MSLSNAASFVLLPPVNLIAAALAGTLLSLRTRRVGQWLALLSVVALAVLSTPLVATWLLVRLEDALPLAPDPANPPQAILLLGADTQRWTAGATDIGMLSLERVRAAAILARRTGLPILVSGGVTSESGADVCAVMAQSLEQDFNQPVRWRECRSLDTWENAALSVPLLAAEGIGSAYIVTHGWHMRRALLAFRPTGLAVTAAPVGIDAEPTVSFGGLVPSARGMHLAYWAIHEWVGLVAYRARLLLRA